MKIVTPETQETKFEFTECSGDGHIPDVHYRPARLWGMELLFQLAARIGEVNAQLNEINARQNRTG